MRSQATQDTLEGVATVQLRRQSRSATCGGTMTTSSGEPEGGKMDRKTYLSERARLDSAAAAYYNSDELVMDDDEYDALARRIITTENKHPDWVSGSRADSVGAGAAAGGEIVHEAPMLSLDNVFDRNELEAFIARSGCERWVVEAKLDGLAASATYVAGRLTTLATRGDGTTGENLLDHHADMTGLPENLSEKRDITVRGEIYMTAEQLARSNEIREQHGDERFVNARNGVAGAMRARHGRWRLPVTFGAYDWSLDDDPDHTAAVDLLARLGVACVSPLTGAVPITSAEVYSEVQRILNMRPNLPFPIDGAVIKAADMSDRMRLAASSRAPRWATAYKFPADTVKTRLLAIELTVGRTGVITPVANVAAVQVGGVTVTNATCSNPSEVVRKDLRVGDMVWIRRAGDVIPEIVKVAEEDRSEDAKPWKAPEGCPRCGGDLDRTGRRWRCTNRTCGAKEALIYFAGRDAMDIDGLGEGVVNALVDAEAVSDAAGLYTLTKEDLLALDGFKEKRASSLIEAIDASRKNELHRLICALGLRGTGRTISKRMADHFGSLDAVLTSSLEDLTQVEGIGVVKAQLVRQELDDANDLIARLKANGVAPPPAAKKQPAAGRLAGKKVVVTGTFPDASRKDVHDLIEALGGVPVSSVSASTDLVVLGDKAGSKADRARKLGVATISYAELEAMR